MKSKGKGLEIELRMGHEFGKKQCGLGKTIDDSDYRTHFLWWLWPDGSCGKYLSGDCDFERVQLGVQE